jgi:hypothetical protein
MNPVSGTNGGVHGNEEKKGRQEEIREEVDEEARSGEVACDPPAAVAARRPVLPALAGSTLSLTTQQLQCPIKRAVRRRPKRSPCAG